ncbi:alpha/beta hydrolase [Deminuibacter soli]|uniref:Esterase family protein n=1 Tax=Deminuibacter soli TaxID=2291815 RepID=A0A3E1NMD9_9BACT|nr:alpha/beta hydrolase-fold protein [Deminuibacter soli]RFM29096.1 esterase family protein [Deminuibacter soli]
MKKIALLLGAMLACSLTFAATVDTISIFSNSMHKNIQCVVVTPNSYQHSQAHYPVVYLLHGYSGNYGDWVKSTQSMVKSADEMNVVVVCPDGAFGSWYFDSPVDTGFKYETHVAKEVPAFIDAHYRTIARREARAISGLSMGGHGALYVAIRHSDVFGAAGSMSGGVDFTPFPKNWDIAKRLGSYEANKALWEQNTVVRAVDSLKNGTLAIAFECGVDDFFIQVNRNLHSKLMEKKIDHDYTERPGRHNWNYWGNAVQYQLLFFRDYFRKQGTAQQ